HRLVFVDGACPNNGQPGARGGIGCAIGNSSKDQISVPVTEAMDPGARRTSQRAELLAALHGLHFIVGTSSAEHDAREGEYIIVADSEYVLKGMTEWMPRWKSNNWKTPQGRVPANLDLFRRLDFAVAEYESRGLKIQFFHVLRQFNMIADGLAKRAAAEPSTVI
ncbi:ribonuclease H-like domain-containing protein, partial [Mycena maculata]